MANQNQNQNQNQNKQHQNQQNQSKQNQPQSIGKIDSKHDSKVDSKADSLPTPKASGVQHSGGSNSSSKDFENNLADLKGLFENGRKMAEDYVMAKRGEIERYAGQSLEAAEKRVIQSLESTLQGSVKVFEKYLGQGRDILQTNISKIEGKPALPVAIAFVAGSFLGVLIASQVKNRGGFGQIVSDIKKAA